MKRNRRAKFNRLAVFYNHTRLIYLCCKSTAYLMAISLTIDGKQVALKKGSSIEYVSENRIFIDADDYSMEIELPVGYFSHARQWQTSSPLLLFNRKSAQNSETAWGSSGRGTVQVGFAAAIRRVHGEIENWMSGCSPSFFLLRRERDSLRASLALPRGR